MRSTCVLFLLLHLLMLSGSLCAQQSQFIRIGRSSVTFPENFNALSPGAIYDKAELIDGYFIRLVLFKKIPDAAHRAYAENRGVRFLSYQGANVYLIAMPEHFNPEDLRPLEPLGFLQMKAEWKCASNLLEPPYGAWAVHGNQIDVDVRLVDFVPVATGAALCRQYGVSVLLEGHQNGFLRIRIQQDDILAVAALPFIQHLELMPPPAEPEDDKERVMQRSNLMDTDYGAGPQWNGDGVKLLLRDDGPVGPHIDFSGRLHNLTPQSSPFDVNHGDRVAGAWCGAGNLDPQTRGAADGASLYNLQYEYSFQDATLSLHQSENITITNSSYGDGCNEGYTIAAQTVDQQLFQNPTLMHVFSGGNNGSSNCDYGAGSGWGNITGGHKMSKNSISVANLRPDQTLSSSSSKGPATDGRIKPDIATLGTNVTMPQEGNTYETSSGTSFSAPALAGGLAQISQAYKALNNGIDPPAALLKAAVLNTATDLGNPGPDFKFGWGRLHTYRAWQTLQTGQFLTGSVDQGALNQHFIDVPEGTQTLKVMLYWADPPADPGAAKNLVNDLDLQLTPPGGTPVLPWVLDPTPVASNLNATAIHGRDSLNNMEQVTISNPDPGQVLVEVNGSEIPFGPQNYYLVWYFETNAVQLTYPIGGEGFTAGQSIQVSWDAAGDTGGFNLSFSPDNGANWTSISLVSGTTRTYDWTLPNVLSGNMRVAVSRSGISDTSAYPFTIAPVPSGLVFDTVCPDFLRVHWNPVNDTLQYQVYLLGERYMELKGVSDTTNFTIPFTNSGSAQWVAVDAINNYGLKSRRSLAVQWTGGLKNCAQPFDISLHDILLPETDPVMSCSAVSQTVKVRVVNEGQQPLSGANISYQLNNQPVQTESLPAIQPGLFADFTFQSPLLLTQNEIAVLKIWSTYAADEVFFNDTLQTIYPVVVQSLAPPFVENFENPVFPPSGWTVINPDDATTWQHSYELLTGPDGQSGKVAMLDCFNYDVSGEEDFLYLQPVDLSAMLYPVLRFQVAHIQYSPTYTESLRLEAYPGCNLNQAPVLLWAKTDPELATGTASTARFVPDEAEDWREEIVDLSALSGQAAILRFVSTNDYGNNIYLDDISLFEHNINPPDVNLSAPADTICPGETLLVTANVSGDSLFYLWSGNGGADTLNGPGPHTLQFPLSGPQVVQLIALNPYGSDTAVLSVYVRELPVSAFTAVADNLTVSFSNNSSGATDFLWDFGDGNTSAEVNPVHQYLGQGVYVVQLLAFNACGDTLAVQQVSTVTATSTFGSTPEVVVHPNPTTGDFYVAFSNAEPGSVNFSLLDAQGREVLTRTVEQVSAGGNVPFTGLDLPEGVYQLKVWSKKCNVVLSVVVQ